MPVIDRRSLVIGGAAGIALGGSVAGAAKRIEHAQQKPARRPNFAAVAKQHFEEEGFKINQRKQNQSAETVAHLKAKYENPVFGRMDVWELIEKMAQCIDTTDSALGCASQLTHVQQAIAAMESEGVTDPDLFLISLLHDLGKVFLLTGEVPENVLCRSKRIGNYPHEIGLDKLVYQFGHGELIYSRIKDHVPEHVAWSARYHMVDMDDAAPFMSEKDREFTSNYLKPFCHYDRDFKATHSVPAVDMDKYQELIRQFFPKPILF